MSTHKLGRNRSVHDTRTLMLSRYLPSPTLAPPPDEVDYHKAVSLPWGEMRNDQVGDCVLAAAGHLQMIWTANRGHQFVPSDDAILKAYEDVGGYDPSNPGTTDNGCDPLSALNYWRKTGIAGKTIKAFGAVNPQYQQRVRQVIDIFEGAYLALQLPLAAQQLTDWDIPSYQPATGDWAPNSWGGHMVCSGRYDTDWCYIVTWGGITRVSWRFLGTYCDEDFAIVSPDSLDLTTGKTPAGLDIATLMADLNAIDSA